MFFLVATLDKLGLLPVSAFCIWIQGTFTSKSLNSTICDSTSEQSMLAEMLGSLEWHEGFGFGLT